MTKKPQYTNIKEDIYKNGQWYCSAKGTHCAEIITTTLNKLQKENENLKKRMEEKKIQ